MKKCKKCGVEKSIDDFYYHEAMADKHLSFCKECVKSRVSKHWYENADILRAKDRERNRKRNIDDKEYVEKKKEYIKTWRTPDKMKAHNMAHRSYHRPDFCEVCGIKCKPVGHHPNYDEPQRVIWCCGPCHKQIHLRLKKQAA